MPKRLTDEQRGPLAAWIVRQREARGWKSEEMPGRLADVGYGVRADYYRQVEAGKKPGPDFLASLERLFGTEYVEPQTPAPAPTPTPDLTTLVAAMTTQATQQAQLITLLTEQNEMLKRLLWPADDTFEASDLTSIGRAAGRLAHAETAGAAATAPPVVLRPASEPHTPSARKRP